MAAKASDDFQRNNAAGFIRRSRIALPQERDTQLFFLLARMFQTKTNKDTTQKKIDERSIIGQTMRAVWGTATIRFGSHGFQFGSGVRSSFRASEV